MKPKNILIIGGGASGYFLAANLPSSATYNVILLEKAKTSLQKVKISGGGRCNLTHACFNPKELIENYPRGNKELLSVFSKFQPADTFSWFEKRGVSLKIEADNRVFPASNNSSSIITVLEKEAVKNNVKIIHNQGVKNILEKRGGFIIETQNQTYTCNILIITSGSSVLMWGLISNLGHTIIPPVPSLFTFNCKNKLLTDMQGASFKNASVNIPVLKHKASGPLLITHWGLSGPVILKLSAFCALELYKLNYHFNASINWIDLSNQKCFLHLKNTKNIHPNKKVLSHKPFDAITKKFWNKILQLSQIDPSKNYSDISNKTLQNIADMLTNYSVKIEGKSTFKDEFVTAGGVDLKEINFKTLQSKLHKNLFFAGEVLNIDAVTGGFNFQACWSKSFLIAEHLKKTLTIS